MVIVVRLAPLPLGHRRASRLAELERVFAAAVELIEVSSVNELLSSVNTFAATAVALDAPAPGQLDDAIAASGSLPVLRPLWRPRRNNQGEMDEVFDGYGLLTNAGVARLGDGELATS